MGHFVARGIPKSGDPHHHPYCGPIHGTREFDMLLSPCPRCGRKSINVGLVCDSDGCRLTSCCPEPTFDLDVERGS